MNQSSERETIMAWLTEGFDGRLISAGCLNRSMMEMMDGWMALPRRVRVGWSARASTGAACGLQQAATT